MVTINDSSFLSCNIYLEYSFNYYNNFNGIYGATHVTSNK